MFRSNYVLVPRRIRSNRKRINLISNHELPEYLQASYGPYIHNHFRPELSWKDALLSFFILHNESVNIWSHTLGFFLMLAFTIDFYFASNSQYPKWPIYIYLCGTMYVMIVSTSAHLFCCMGKKVYNCVWKFDYTAITVVMYTMYYPWVIYIFEYDPFITTIYLSLTGILAIIMFILGLSNVYQNPKYHSLQPVMFLLFGFCGLVPMIHSAILFWTSVYAVRYAFFLTFLQLFLNLVGGLSFSFRFPERYFPGKLDILGNSHQIMHFAVIGAFVSYYYASLALWKMKKN